MVGHLSEIQDDDISTQTWGNRNKRSIFKFDPESAAIDFEGEDEILLAGELDAEEINTMAPEAKKTKAEVYKMPLNLPRKFKGFLVGSVVPYKDCDPNGRNSKTNAFKGSYPSSAAAGNDVMFILLFVWQTCNDTDKTIEVAMVVPRSWISKCFHYLKVPRLGNWFMRFRKPTTERFITQGEKKNEMEIEWDVSRYMRPTAYSTAEKALDVCNAILEGLYVEGGSDFEGSFLDKAEYINYLCNSKNYTEEQVQMCQEKNKLVAAVMAKLSKPTKRPYQRKRSKKDDDGDKENEAPPQKEPRDTSAGGGRRGGRGGGRGRGGAAGNKQGSSRGKTVKLVDDPPSPPRKARIDDENAEDSDEGIMVGLEEPIAAAKPGADQQPPSAGDNQREELGEEGFERINDTGFETAPDNGGGHELWDQFSQNNTFSQNEATGWGLGEQGQGVIMSRSSVGQMEESQLPFDQFLMAGEGGSQQDLSLSQMPETQLPETQFPAPTMDGSDGSQAEQLHQDFVVLPQAPARAVQVLYSSHDSDGEALAPHSCELQQSQHNITTMKAYHNEMLQASSAAPPVLYDTMQPVRPFAGPSTAWSPSMTRTNTRENVALAKAPNSAHFTMSTPGNGGPPNPTTSSSPLMMPSSSRQQQVAHLAKTPNSGQQVTPRSTPGNGGPRPNPTTSSSPLMMPSSSRQQQVAHLAKTPNSGQQVITPRSTPAGPAGGYQGSGGLFETPGSQGSVHHHGRSSVANGTPSGPPGAGSLGSGRSLFEGGGFLTGQQVSSIIKEEAAKLNEEIHEAMDHEGMTEPQKTVLKMGAKIVDFIAMATSHNVENSSNVGVGVASELHRMRQERAKEPEEKAPFVDAPAEFGLRFPLNSLAELKLFDRHLEKEQTFKIFKTYLEAVKGLCVPETDKVRACWVAVFAPKLTLNMVWKRNGPDMRPVYSDSCPRVLDLFGAIFGRGKGIDSTPEWRFKLRNFKQNSRRLTDNRPENVLEENQTYCRKWTNFVKNLPKYLRNEEEDLFQDDGNVDE